ncbi:MAG: hypothetical protein JNJ45_08005 [Chthonomonas sp.]|nr:hypothetical protein [Chthonomonas sp.]
MGLAAILALVATSGVNGSSLDLASISSRDLRLPKGDRREFKRWHELEFDADASFEVRQRLLPKFAKGLSDEDLTKLLIAYNNIDPFAWSVEDRNWVRKWMLTTKTLNRDQALIAYSTARDYNLVPLDKVVAQRFDQWYPQAVRFQACYVRGLLRHYKREEATLLWKRFRQRHAQQGLPDWKTAYLDINYHEWSQHGIHGARESLPIVEAAAESAKRMMARPNPPRNWLKSARSRYKLFTDIANAIRRRLAKEGGEGR